MRRVERVHTRSGPDYPERPADRMKDASRRRFLGLMAAGAGAAALGLPRLAHGQSLAVDFTILDSHPPLVGTAAPGPAPGDSAGVGEARGDSAGPASTDAPIEREQEVPWIEENRALWVDPGYLVLVRLQRASDDLAPVAALEGAAAMVQAFLAGRVTEVEDLHDLDRLHALEGELLALLQGVVAPALITVLHLDHDCNTVCNHLDPGAVITEPIPLRGGPVSVDWE